jgi:hypothetical protein
MEDNKVEVSTAVAEVPAVVNKKNNTKKIIDSFMTSVDANQYYSLEELKKLLSEAYKLSKKKKSKDNVEKKEPSQYNIFIKDEMNKIRKESPDVDNKKLMSMAAARWSDYKIANGIGVAK